MPHTQLGRANTAYEHYVHTLTSAYRRYLYITDPDYATQNEPDAWLKVRRDADIAHAIQKRRQSVAGLDFIFNPPTDDPQNKAAAEWMEWLLSKVRNFHFKRYNLAEAIFRGTSYAYIRGRRGVVKVPGMGTNEMWVPTDLIHVDRFRFRVRRVDDADEENIRTIWEFFSVKQDEWLPLERTDLFIRHAFEETEDTLGYGRGLLQAIYYFWRAKEIVLSQGLAGVERWAQGLVEVGVDGLRPGSTGRNNDEIVDAWIEEMAKHRSEHTLVHDKKDEIKVHDWAAQGAQMVIKFLELLQKSLDRLILTSQLPTGGGKEGAGSLARSAVEAEEMEATFQADRLALSESIDRGLARLVWRRNAGMIRAALQGMGLPMADRPTFAIKQRKINDPKLNAEIIAAALQNNIPLKAQQVYEKLELDQPMDDDDVIVPVAASQMAGIGGFGQDAARQMFESGHGVAYMQMKLGEWKKLLRDNRAA